MRFLCTMIPALIALSMPLQAQSVKIDAASDGQGYMIKDNGICWVLMPRHLLDEFSFIEVETSPAPSVRGSGEAYADFWDGMDFAIGVVGQAAGSTACTARLGTITQPRLTAGQVLRGDLRFVEPGGGITQRPMRIVDLLDHKSFVAEFSEPGDRAFQGLSGAFLFAQDVPLGMAIQSPDGANRMTFIRIEEIAFATRRWLAGRARAVTDAAAQTQVQAGDGQLPLTLLDYQTPPLSPDTTPVHLADGTGAYHFEFTGPTTLIFGVGEGAAVGVSRVRIVSEGDGAKPLALRVMIDPSANGGNPQRFARGQMPPTGEFDSGRKAERFARRVIITIDSVQGAGPVRIDRVEVY